MTKYSRQLWDSITKLSRVQHIGLLAFVIIALLATDKIVTLAFSNKTILLFEDKLKIEDVGKITAKLKELGIEYRLKQGSTEILVSRTDKSYILLLLAQERILPQTNACWQKLIEEHSNFDLEADNNADLIYFRELQWELERALQRMSKVDCAKVFIGKYKKDPKELSASILLRLRVGAELTRNEIQAIRAWICSAVESLEPHKVIISDTKARILG